MTAIKVDDYGSIFKKKLIYDGNGTGEDRRLLNLIRSITKFCLVEDTSEETLKSINKDLSAAINAAEKSVKISQMCDRTFEILDKAIEEKTRDIDEVRTKLANLQLELEFVEKLKKVNAYPDCKSTEETMKLIEMKKEHLMRRIAGQSCNLRTLSEACKSLQKVIEDDEQAEQEFNRLEHEIQK